MNRKPVFTICFVATVLILGGFQLWADGPFEQGAEAIKLAPILNGYQPSLVPALAHKEHDLGDGLRATLEQPQENALSSFELTVTNTSSERVKCAVDIQMAVSEQNMMSRVPRPPTVSKRTDKMVVWLDPGESESRTVKTKVAANAFGTAVQVTLRRGRTVIPGALTMGIIAPSGPMDLRVEPNERPMDLPSDPPANAVLPREVFGAAPAPVAAN